MRFVIEISNGAGLDELGVHLETARYCSESDDNYRARLLQVWTACETKAGLLKSVDADLTARGMPSYTELREILRLVSGHYNTAAAMLFDMAGEDATVEDRNNWGVWYANTLAVIEKATP